MRRHNSRHQPVINFGLVWWGPNREVRANGKESSVVFYCSSRRGILILMKVEISNSTWFQVVPICSLILEQFLFSLSDDFLLRL